MAQADTAHTVAISATAIYVALGIVRSGSFASDRKTAVASKPTKPKTANMMPAAAATTWAPDMKPVAYFSMEYAYHESLPIYSGGLGVLAGDHCKSASDLGLPFTAVGMLFSQGYFRQLFAHRIYLTSKN